MSSRTTASPTLLHQHQRTEPIAAQAPAPPEPTAVQEPLGQSRASAFSEMDQPALRAMPERRYEYAKWKMARVGVDYRRGRRPLPLSGPASMRGPR